MDWRGFFLLAVVMLLVLSNICKAMAQSSGESSVTTDEGTTTLTEGTTTIRVLSFNIHHGEGIDGVLDLERIVSVISQSGADVVALQEVDVHFRERSGFEDQAKKLAESLGMYYIFGANIDLEPLQPGAPRRQYGNAVLSKYPILYHQNYHLSSLGQEQRGLLEAVIDVDGTQLCFYSTHLGTVEQRLTQVNELLEITGKRAGPKIIAGDFNSVPGSDPIKTMATVYKNVFADMTVYTAPSNWPTSQIDHIFTSDDLLVVEAQVVRINQVASDHFPIMATIALRQASAPDSPIDNGTNRL